MLPSRVLQPCFALAGRQMLDYAATASLAVPSVVLDIGYLRTFHQFEVPWLDKPLTSWWVIIVIALLIRRLPYALRACMAALQQLSVALEEAAENLGAGKARTIRRIVVPLMAGGILAGFGLEPAGTILIDGQQISKLPPWQRNVGMVFQSFALWSHMTLRRNLAFGLEERRQPRAEIHRRVDEALALVGLQDLADRRPAQLSGGHSILVDEHHHRGKPPHKVGAEVLLQLNPDELVPLPFHTATLR